ncbi:hypothetical protein DLAC_02067 [Tieghemostelium lacteum]|uniref:Peptidase A1 domain-containing protein n=1 Tax=Tieghemostelium lacteum TaxID=361077 RepID=A0A152A435_TIELA|nr:hypothetical protein DLAC_02067 [Tieghemostelium lacteum]|eukprot:KYR00990.1 hypothetical protein DLAC_02067 [Tieghemostelium lacteum]
MINNKTTLLAICVVIILLLYEPYKVQCRRLNVRKKIKKTSDSIVIGQKEMKYLESLDSISSIIMYGGLTTFEFYIPILVGNPPQMFTVIVDTGSTALAIPSPECYLYRSRDTKSKCLCSSANMDGTYLASWSATSQLVQCSDSSKCPSLRCGNDGQSCLFNLTFADQSFLDGYLVYDQVTLGDYQAMATFGAIQRESLTFSHLSCPLSQEEQNQIPNDGILGLSYQSLDPNNGDSIFSKIVQQNNLSDSFSMCMGQHGGVLVLGGVDNSSQLGPMLYTNITNEKFYSINIMDVHIDGTALNIPSSAFGKVNVVDSGTSLLILNQAIYIPFTLFLTQRYPTLPGFGLDYFWLGKCHLIEDISIYPTFHLVIPGSSGISNFTLEIKPSLYLIPLDDQPFYYCFGIQTIPYNTDIGILVGDVVLQNYNVHYNRERGQIGFAPISQCNSIYTQSDSYQLVKIDGDQQQTNEGQLYDRALTVQIQSTINSSTVVALNAIIVEFQILSGSAQFYPSSLQIIRNMSDYNGIVTMMVMSSGYGNVQIQCQIWDLKSSTSVHTVQFTLHSKMKPWKIVTIILSCVAVLVFICILTGYLIHKKRLLETLKNYYYKLDNTMQMLPQSSVGDTSSLMDDDLSIDDEK